MKTKIKTIHEEQFSDGSRTFGVLLNYSSIEEWFASYIYIYHEGMYIFFNTIVDMIDYNFYCKAKVNRAYMEEHEFDKIYDNEIDGKFSDMLEWIENS
jgi:hypothetical protein